jgi:hypothetical protein
MPKPIEFRKLETAELLKLYNEIAEKLGKRTMRNWTRGRCELIERVALIRTRRLEADRVAAAREAKEKRRRARARPRVKKQRRQPIRDCAMRYLSHVAYWADAKTGERLTKRAARTVPVARKTSYGLPYAAIVEKVKEKFPESRITNSGLRWIVAMIRDRSPGFERCNLPQKRERTINGST